MGYALGIDLGTTFSAAGITQGDRTEIVPLGNRAATIPSVVVLRSDGEVLIGDAAVRRSLTEPMRTAREFKRRLGDPTPLLLGGTPYGAEALMAHLLAGIVRQVVEQQGEEPDHIVISHPANYGPYKLDLLEQAVRMAEIGKVSFIPEPVAAAMHYAIRERIEPGQIVAVYDLGGGTFDAALLRKTASGFEQIGEPEGMERLGGIDFDEAIFAHVVQAIGPAWQQLDPVDPSTVAAVARLRDDCREAKEALSIDTDATIPVMLPNIQTEVRITRGEFEEMIRPRIHETIAALMRAIRSGNVETTDIARVLLVGGSSRIPLVGQMVREATGVPVAVDAHPKHAIALGAALAASQVRPARPDPALYAPTILPQQSPGLPPVPDATIAVNPPPQPPPADPGSAGQTIPPASFSQPVPISHPPQAAPPQSAPPLADITQISSGAAGARMVGQFENPLPQETFPSTPPPTFTGNSNPTLPPSSPPPAQPPVTAGRSGNDDGGSRLPLSQIAIGGTIAALLLVGLVAFLLFQFLGDDEDDPDDLAGTLGDVATATATEPASITPTATGAPEPTATTPAAAAENTQVVRAPEPTATNPPPTWTPAPPTNTPELEPTATPTPTVEPTRTPPVPPGVEYANILDIQWHEEHQHYHIEFEMYELDILHPDGIDDPHTAQFARPHVHFFVNTVPPDQAGAPGSGPWQLYAGPSPYDGFTPADIPDDATEICVLIANHDHSVRPDTGNCYPLPPRT